MLSVRVRPREVPGDGGEDCTYEKRMLNELTDGDVDIPCKAGSCLLTKVEDGVTSGIVTRENPKDKE